MQIQRVNNQQSFTATLKYERTNPRRLWDFVGDSLSSTPEDKFGLKAETALEMLKKWLTEGKPKQVFGKFVKDRFAGDVYEQPKAVKIGNDVIILDETKAPNHPMFPSEIRILFGKDASEGTAEIKNNTGMGEKLFAEVVNLIKAVR